ncbi:MAG: OB-fold domain-containing protein [Chloroflexi bacterium]|nr:OB-fold domain-containing protein [Chloroflexota bacterium]
MPKLVPMPDEVSQPFWDACNERRLTVQNCTACNRMQFPPEKACYACGSDQNLAWREVSGRGKVHGYCVMYDSRLKLLQLDQPFNIVIIELEEDPAIKMLSHLPGRAPDDVPVGGKVMVDFQEVAPGRLVHEFRVVE